MGFTLTFSPSSGIKLKQAQLWALLWILRSKQEV